jgi:flagellin-specific chaperone FliS
MRRLYNYFERLIWESNVKKNAAGVGEVIRHLNVLRDAWATMLTNQGASAPAATAARAAA